MPTVDLVTVAIPTWNRAASLRRALESVLSQDYASLEVIVGDNASEDETDALRREVEKDPRVRWIKHESNIGALRNFESLLELARGKYFAWLADDDWLSPGYVTRCVSVLSSCDAPAHVVGRAIYRRGGEVVRTEEAQLDSDQPERRVLDYYRSVQGNPFFYSMCRTEQAGTGLPFAVVHGSDWLHVARLVFLGKALTLSDISLNVTLYDSDDAAQGDHTLGAGWRRMAFKMLFLPLDAARDVLQHPVYGTLSPWRRRLLAVQCAPLLSRRLSNRDSLKAALAMVLHQILPAAIYRRVRSIWRTMLDRRSLPGQRA